MKITVSKNNNGDFSSISEALLAVGQDGADIYISEGEYFERLVIDKPNIRFFGLGKNNSEVVINNNYYAKMLDNNNQEIGTFKTATVQVTPEAEGFEAHNLTFENSAGSGMLVGQAVALYLDCDKAVIENCRLVAYQDTLLTAPYFLEIEKNPSVKRRQFFKDCLIIGDVDFIFGGAVACFWNCEIYSRDRKMPVNGYLTAACTSEALKYGYVFYNCKLTAQEGIEEGSVYLGRPWREYAKTVFISCEIGKHINKDLYSVWNDTDRHKSCYYAVYNCNNSDGIIDWAHQLSDEEAKEYTLENVFEGWLPD